ncbi:MAG: hypothetical protein ACXWJK_08315 [Burkholderiaceae bacterium]
MKSSTKQSGQLSPLIKKMSMAFAALTMLGGVLSTPALANSHEGRHDNGRHHGERHGERDRWHEQSDYRDRYDSYHYSAPVYAPPVYYAPQQRSGVSLFLPLDVRF